MKTPVLVGLGYLEESCPKKTSQKPTKKTSGGIYNDAQFTQVVCGVCGLACFAQHGHGHAPPEQKFPQRPVIQMSHRQHCPQGPQTRKESESQPKLKFKAKKKLIFHFAVFVSWMTGQNRTIRIARALKGVPLEGGAGCGGGTSCHHAAPHCC